MLRNLVYAASYGCLSWFVTSGSLCYEADADFNLGSSAGSLNLIRLSIIPGDLGSGRFKDGFAVLVCTGSALTGNNCSLF